MYIVWHLRVYDMPQDISITDGCACAGGNTLSFARFFHVCAISVPWSVMTVVLDVSEGERR